MLGTKHKFEVRNPSHVKNILFDGFGMGLGHRVKGMYICEIVFQN